MKKCVILVEKVIGKSCISWLYIDYSQESTSAVPPVFEIIDPKAW
jgi:hypothetical protein